jgi:TRAP-type C4-dicarboxylate transport system substrate-binding protein
MEDLKGLKMRAAGAYDRFMRKMGMIPVTVMVTDVYTALERGTVDGFGWPLIGALDLGWTDTCKYVVDHPFNVKSNGAITMNLDAWNRLPGSLKKRLIEITAKFEPDMVKHFIDAEKKEWEKLKKIGVKAIHFAPEEGKKYLEIIDSTNWEIMEEKVPELVPELKKVCGYGKE